uniref:WAS/WASL interacting protein family member 2 n=1 Tax=Gallus gallus TaxID=9031 RepID=A0A8V1A0B6_CHICK
MSLSPLQGRGVLPRVPLCHCADADLALLAAPPPPPPMLRNGGRDAPPPPPPYRLHGSTEPPSRGKPPPPPTRTPAGPPPPPPPVRNGHRDSIATVRAFLDDFESKYSFHPVEDFPAPEEYKYFQRIYPSKTNRATRGAPPLPPIPRNLHEKLRAPSALPGQADAPSPRSPQTHTAPFPAAPRWTPRCRHGQGRGQAVRCWGWTEAGAVRGGAAWAQSRGGQQPGCGGCGGCGMGPAERSAPLCERRFHAGAAGSGTVPPRWVRGGGVQRRGTPRAPKGASAEGRGLSAGGSEAGGSGGCAPFCLTRTAGSGLYAQRGGSH